MAGSEIWRSSDDARTDDVGPVRMAAYELRMLTRCDCAPDWTDRGKHHPRECAADYRDDVDTLITEVDRLRAELDRHRVAGDAMADAKNWVGHVVEAERWRSVRGDAPAAPGETNEGLAAAVEIVGTPSGAMTYMAMADALGRIAEMVGVPSDVDEDEIIVSAVRKALARPAAAPTDGQAPADMPDEFGPYLRAAMQRPEFRRALDDVQVRDELRSAAWEAFQHPTGFDDGDPQNVQEAVEVAADAVIDLLVERTAAAPDDDTAAPDGFLPLSVRHEIAGALEAVIHRCAALDTDPDVPVGAVSARLVAELVDQVETLTGRRPVLPWETPAARPVRDGGEPK